MGSKRVGGRAEFARYEGRPMLGLIIEDGKEGTCGVAMWLGLRRSPFAIDEMDTLGRGLPTAVVGGGGDFDFARTRW